MSGSGGERRPPDRTVPDRIEDAPRDEHPPVTGEQRPEQDPAFELDVSRMLPPLDSAPGPARRLSSARTAAMVSAIVDEATAGARETDSQGFPGLSPFEVTRSIVIEPPAARAPRGLVRRGAMLTAVLVMASVSSAVAGIWIVVRERPGTDSPPAITNLDEPERAGSPRRNRAPAAAQVIPAPSPADGPAQAQEPAPTEGEPPADVVEDEAGESAEPEELDRPTARRKRPVGTRRRQPPDPQGQPDREPETEPAGRGITMVLPPNAGVEDIVALANQRRKEKRWRAAAELYERVIRDYGGTDAAAIATVASASLHLDHLADPEGALQRFRKALRLRPHGPLAEEARWGLAETYRALGNEEAEGAALRAFLSAHARSVNAARARRRLAELGTDP